MPPRIGEQMHTAGSDDATGGNRGPSRPTTDGDLPPLLATTAGVAAGLLVVTVLFGAWTVTAFLVPWVAGVALLVLPALLARAVLRRQRPAWVGAVWGVGLGLVAVAALLVVDPMAGMAGALLPAFAVVVGGLLGFAGSAIGSRLRSPRLALALIALAIAGALLVAVLGRP